MQVRYRVPQKRLTHGRNFVSVQWKSYLRFDIAGLTTSWIVNLSFWVYQPDRHDDVEEATLFKRFNDAVVKMLSGET